MSRLLWLLLNGLLCGIDDFSCAVDLVASSAGGNELIGARLGERGLLNGWLGGLWKGNVPILNCLDRDRCRRGRCFIDCIFSNDEGVFDDSGSEGGCNFDLCLQMFGGDSRGRVFFEMVRRSGDLLCLALNSNLQLRINQFRFDRTRTQIYLDVLVPVS